MFSNFDYNVIERSWRYLFFDGMAFTLRLTLLAMAGGIVFGTLLAMMRLSSIKPLAWIAGTYVNVLRSIPLVLVIFWFYFLAPYMAAWVVHSDTPVRVGAFASSLLTFAMFEACYYCEIMRAGIQSIPRGQVSAGYAMGLNYWQTMGHIVLPQAFRNMVPILLTQTIVLYQDVSLVYVLSITDFVGAASKVAERDGRLVEMYTFVAVVYFISCFALSLVVRKLQNRIAIVR
ncbi:MAG TPA: ABC transporter permease subunit [Burkholderiales bacterium]|nr:ABC transporter permease subunit [Burkholderiales bacterium]